MSNRNDNLQKFPDELGTLINIMRDYNFLKNGLKGVARNYDALPGGAMILVAVFDLLTICAKKSPELRPLHKDLFNVLKSHYHAEVKSLDEAFSLERKPHWRQHSENFARLYGRAILAEIVPTRSSEIRPFWSASSPERSRALASPRALASTSAFRVR